MKNDIVIPGLLVLGPGLACLAGWVVAVVVVNVDVVAVAVVKWFLGLPACLLAVMRALRSDVFLLVGQPGKKIDPKVTLGPAPCP